MEWINIKIAIPKKEGFYFTYGTEGCDYQFFKDGKWGIGHGKTVTHWMIPKLIGHGVKSLFLIIQVELAQM